MPNPTGVTDRTDVTGVANEEKTLVVGIPAGIGNESDRVETPPATLDAVGSLQTVLNKVDSPIEPIPAASNTPDMPTGMRA
jgi:hypothetical protein